MSMTVLAAVNNTFRVAIIHEGSRDRVGLYSIEQPLQAIVF